MLPVLDDADPAPPCEAVAWNSPPRNCCSAALIEFEEADDVAEVESIEEELEVDAVEDVLPDAAPSCASAAAIAAARGLVADALPVDDESESSGEEEAFALLDHHACVLPALPDKAEMDINVLRKISETFR